MTIISSLTNRIFMAAALLAVLSIAFAIYFVNRSVTREAEAELQRGLREAGTLVEQYRTTLFENFTSIARLIADLPKLKAAVATKDPITIQETADEYLSQKLVVSDLFVLTDATGRVFGATGRSAVPRETIPTLPAVRRALEGKEASSFWPHPEGLLQVVTVPIVLDTPRPGEPGRVDREMLGTLSVGFLLDDRLTAQFKDVTESEVAFVADGRVVASTLPVSASPKLAALIGNPDRASRLVLGGDDYVALVRPITTSGSASARVSSIETAPGTSAPIAVILRSRTERLRFLNAIHTALAATAVFAVLLATVLSYAIARTVTRPLGTLTTAMREIAATGDLTRRTALRTRRWDDEDARLLASTFNTLTESVARFQREASQRERLSSLGRLSTVIAHEIRNPLMIIKASLRTVGREDAAPHERAEAAADIDEEVTRLNRVVNDVLDFARPIRFECRPLDLNGLCAEAAAAATAADPSPAIRFGPDPGVGDVTTDGERLRLVLVNMLTNARHAVLERHAVSDAKGAAPVAVAVADPPPVHMRTERLGGDRVGIVISDRGVGIAAQDLARVFDPYFTTKRTGSGLGLPIAKNIIEGLGGSIAISSRPNEGTEIRLVLPRLCRSS